MPSTSGKSRKGNDSCSNVAILVTGPSFKTDVGGVLVESERYETVNFDAVEEPQNKGGQFFGLLGSLLGRDSSNLTSPVELVDFRGRQNGDATKVVPSPSSQRDPSTVMAGDFDICREYSYTTDEDETDADAPSLISDPCTKEEDGSKLRVYLLGKSYDPVQNYNDRRSDESALFWFTYRCDFPEIAPYGIRSDAGWGCMLRSAQMLLGQALRVHFKSRGWVPPRNFAARRNDPFIRSLLTWVADFPSTNQCYYSLHNMVAAGLKYDKLPGEWYGPGAACYVLRDLAEMHERQQLSNKNISQQNRIFRVHVAPQGTVYRDAVKNLMTCQAKVKLAQETEKKHKVNPQSHPLDLEWEEELLDSVGTMEWDTGLLLLVPVRLGLENIQEEYLSAIAHTFSFPQSVGILGGRVRGARWFYGAISDGSKVYGLDPHTVQGAPRSRSAKINGKVTTTVDLTDEYLKSCHTTYPEVLSLQKMDPSIAFGFYCRNQKDFENLVSLVETWKKMNPRQPEIFAVADSSPSYAVTGSSSVSEMLISSSLLDGDDGDGSKSSGNDDYVML